MRICISGPGCQGKSTLINDFLENWPSYTTPKKTYRDQLLKEKRKHSKYTDKDTQWAILNSMIDELHKHNEDSKVIFDRGPIDNLVYTLWAYSKDMPGIDEKYVSKTIELVKESVKHLDINFLIPITKFNDFDYTTKLSEQDSILTDKQESVDESFIEETNSIFQAIKTDWETNPDTKFFDIRDMPPVIEIFGSAEERIKIIELYLDSSGDLIDDTGVLNEADLYQQSVLADQLGIEDTATKAAKNPKGYQ